MRLAQGNSAGCLSFFLSFFFWPCHAACGIYFPHQGLNPLPPIFKYAFLTTRLLGKSQQYVFLYSCSERLPVNLCMISLILARLVPNYNKCVTGLSRIRWKVHQTRQLWPGNSVTQKTEGCGKVSDKRGLLERPVSHRQCLPSRGIQMQPTRTLTWPHGHNIFKHFLRKHKSTYYTK